MSQEFDLVENYKQIQKQQTGENVCKIYDKRLISLLHKESFEYIKTI